jgi:putative membrane-bound dehydrogenase-like protein
MVQLDVGIWIFHPPLSTFLPIVYIPSGQPQGLSATHMRLSKTNKALGWPFLLALIQSFLLPPSAPSAESTNAPVIRASNALTGFRIRPGFRIELVADNSVVSAPAAMAFDENGRLYVAEMRDYPERRDQPPYLGQIRLLQDADGDGVFESSTVFADNLPMPSAIACYDGGIFVAATPDILYLKDINEDGVADDRKTVFSGFGSGPFRSDFVLNNFTWGLDNRIHGGAAQIGGTITALEGKGEQPIALDRYDFSFDPRALTISPEAGSAQSGLVFDNRGHKFFCDFTHPLREAAFDPLYFSRNPYFPPAEDAVDVESPSTAIFKLTSVNSVPANPRAQSRPSPAAGIQSRSFFNRARGCVIYRGNAFPSNFVGNAFIADSDAHCVHRVLLRDNGIVMTAVHPSDEQGTEFFLSTDPSFRPSQIINGPDGALYIADFRDGGDSGRILRIVPENFKQQKPPQLATARTYDLVATLAHVDGWHRDTAARLLCEKRDPTAIGLLTNMVNNSRSPVARLHALATLDSFRALNETVLLKALRDSDPAIRERAVLLSERLINDGLISEPLWNQLRFMGDDNSPTVRHQLALTLGQVRHQGRPQLLARMLQRASGDPLMETAIFSSLGEGAAECFVALADGGAMLNNPTGLELLRRLALMVGTQGSMDQVTIVVDWLDRNSPNPRDPNSYVLAAGLGEGLRRTGSSLALVDPQHRLERVYSQAVGMSVDYKVADPLRLQAIRLLGVGSYSVNDVGDWFLLLLDANQSPAIQSAAIRTLTGYSDPRVVTSLLARWQVLTPTLRQQVVAAFLTRADRVDTVLAAIESGRIPPEDVSPTEANLLRHYPDASIRQRAVRIFGPPAPQRPAALANFQPALRLVGDPNYGRELYQARCASCHHTGDNSRTFGPDLADLRALGKERLLSAIIQPSAGSQSRYLTYLIETKNGHLHLGILNHQNSKTVTLITQGLDEPVLPRANIQSIHPEPWSFMPDGLEQGLNPQAMADLLQFILSPAR